MFFKILKISLCINLMTIISDPVWFAENQYEVFEQSEENGINQTRGISFIYQSVNGSGVSVNTVCVDFSLAGTSAVIKFTDLLLATLGGKFTGTVTVIKNGNVYYYNLYTNVKTIYLSVPSSGASITLYGTYKYTNPYFSDSTISFGYAW